jgi:hypothetical protein
MILPTQSFGEVLAALRRPSDNAEQEKRRATRMLVEAPVDVSFLSDSKAPRRLTALTRDVSHHGLGMLVSTELKAADRLVVHLPRQGRTAVSVLCEVKVCHRLADGIFKVGVEFVRELPEPDAVAAPGGAASQARVGSTAGAAAAAEEVRRIQRSILAGS